MSMLYVMVPAALALALAALLAFIWAVRSGQFDDPQSYSYRMLFDDEPNPQDRQARRDEHGESHQARPHQKPGR